MKMKIVDVRVGFYLLLPLHRKEVAFNVAVDLNFSSLSSESSKIFTDGSYVYSSDGRVRRKTDATFMRRMH